MQSEFSCIKYNANAYTEFDHPNTIALQLLYLKKAFATGLHLSEHLS